MSLRCRLKNLVHKGLLKKEDLDRIVIIPKEQENKVIKMREATPEERESISKYINNISNPTVVNFWDLDSKLCDDCISRQQAINKMQELEDEDIKAYGCEIPEGFDGKRAIEALKSLPPSIQSSTSIFGKIRAEIEALPKTYPFINHIDTYVKEDDVKEIIDKYKIESEDKEHVSLD